MHESQSSKFYENITSIAQKKLQIRNIFCEAFSKKEISRVGNNFYLNCKKCTIFGELEMLEFQASKYSYMIPNIYIYIYITGLDRSNWVSQTKFIKYRSEYSTKALLHWQFL